MTTVDPKVTAVTVELYSLLRATGLLGGPPFPPADSIMVGRSSEPLSEWATRIVALCNIIDTETAPDSSSAYADYVEGYPDRSGSDVAFSNLTRSERESLALAAALTVELSGIERDAHGPDCHCRLCLSSRYGKEATCPLCNSEDPLVFKMVPCGLPCDDAARWHENRNRGL